jgi:hypothetical protein
VTPKFPSGRPLFSLPEDVVVSSNGHRLSVRGRWGDVELADDTPMVREALRRMSMGPVSLENLPALSTEFTRWRNEGICGPGWPRLKRTLDQLGGLVVPSLGLHDEPGPILSLVAVVPEATFQWPQIADTDPIQVPARARIEYIDGDQTLVRPGPPYVVVLHRAPAIGIANRLLDGRTTVAGLAERLGIGREIVADVVAYLASADLIRTEEPEWNNRAP